MRIAGLLRGTESAAQAVSYGLNSVESFGTIGASALNFGLWGASLVPAWFVVREIGVTLEGRVEKEARLASGDTMSKTSHGAEEDKEAELDSEGSHKDVKI